MNFAVVGATGLLGQEFLSLANASSLNVRSFGRQNLSFEGNPETIARTIGETDVIINCVAYTAVDLAESNPDDAFLVNHLYAEKLAMAAKLIGARFMHVSTDYVFDGDKYGFYLEDDLRNPLGVYGKSKAAGEEAIAREFVNSTAGQYAIFRTSWVYGDGGNFIRTILRLAKDREELKIIADQFGVPTSAEWLAQISLSLALNNRGQLNTFPSGIYHAVPAGETTWHGLAQSAIKAAIALGVKLKAEPEAIKAIPAVEYPLPAPRPMNSRMSTDKLQSVLSLSNSYNDVLKDQSFPHWEPMVHEYIHKLASNGLI